MVILYKKKPVLNAVLKLVDLKNQMCIKFSSVKTLNTHMKTQILDLKYLVHDRPALNHMLKYSLFEVIHDAFIEIFIKIGL